jgi:hypothetical protein
LIEVSGQLTPRPLYPQGKSPWYPLSRRLPERQSRTGRGGEKISQPLPGLESQTIQPAAQRYTTDLSRLLILIIIIIIIIIIITTTTTTTTT